MERMEMFAHISFGICLRVISTRRTWQDTFFFSCVIWIWKIQIFPTFSKAQRCHICVHWVALVWIRVMFFRCCQDHAISSSTFHQLLNQLSIKFPSTFWRRWGENREIFLLSRTIDDVKIAKFFHPTKHERIFFYDSKLQTWKCSLHGKVECELQIFHRFSRIVMLISCSRVGETISSRELKFAMWKWKSFSYLFCKRLPNSFSHVCRCLNSISHD